MSGEGRPADPLPHAFKAAGGSLRLDAFIELSLYAPRWGYYRRDRARVGRAPGTDFTTASAVGPEFGMLVAALAEARLRGAGLDPREVTFVECGAEPGAAILEGQPHPFAGLVTRRVGQGFADLPSPRVVFGNELLDAQPFRRFVWAGAEWREAHVARDPATGGLAMDLRDCPVGDLPVPMATVDTTELDEGWTVDFPSGAIELMAALAEGDWAGAVVMFDYGRDWREIVLESPAGTGRTYRDHRVGADLLEAPGETDITCHVPWDLLAGVLEARGFRDVAVERQESAFMLRCPAAATALLAPRPGEPATERLRRTQAVKTLLHPAHYGAKFQVLSAVRG